MNKATTIPQDHTLASNIDGMMIIVTLNIDGIIIIVTLNMVQ